VHKDAALGTPSNGDHLDGSADRFPLPFLLPGGPSVGEVLEPELGTLKGCTVVTARAAAQIDDAPHPGCGNLAPVDVFLRVWHACQWRTGHWHQERGRRPGDRPDALRELFKVHGASMVLTFGAGPRVARQELDGVEPPLEL
jgi:hypothetical protein